MPNHNGVQVGNGGIEHTTPELKYDRTLEIISGSNSRGWLQRRVDNSPVRVILS